MNGVVDLLAHKYRGDNDAMRLACERLLLNAADARDDIGKFFTFVMREETTRLPVVLLPHQRVFLDFVLAHERSVNMLPVGHSKTFLTAALTLFLMGQNPTTRGLVVSATQEQSSKVLKMVGDYIRESRELHLTFPKLQPSTRRGDQWTQTSITVDRPAGIRDASLRAVGDGSQGIAGSRLNWVIVDDLLSWENTATKAQRDKTYHWFDSEVLSRLDPKGARIVITNTARHPEDIMHRLEAAGWPTMRMDILGNVRFQDDVELIREGHRPWRHKGLRLSSPNPMETTWRLTHHDPDPTNSSPLWPAKFPNEEVEKLRRRHLPHEFNQLYLNLCRDDNAAMCKTEWVDACKAHARDAKHFTLVGEHRGEHNFTGVDLAFRQGEEADYTAFFTFEQLANGRRKILDVEFGQWDAPTIVDKLFDKHKRYNSVLRVENNAAQQAVLEFARKKNMSLPLKAHTTGRNKAHPEYGVQRLFMDMQNGVWLIPNDAQGRCHPAVQKWIDECLYYTPSAHTGDLVMASWFAREQCREFGWLNGFDSNAQMNGAIGMHIMSR
jgi:hypothetical protein